MENIYPSMFPSSSSNHQNSHFPRINIASSHAQDQEFQDHKPFNHIGYITSLESSATVPISNEVENDDNSSKKKGQKKSRKPRFAFQTRSQVDILDDGYRWRKYGQKAVKNTNSQGSSLNPGLRYSTSRVQIWIWNYSIVKYTEIRRRTLEGFVARLVVRGAVAAPATYWIRCWG
ncbi:hypothetical protein F511_25474 [Dorcoceras hygrometricum]|uniref:WRKY domain-containing protein n=1 Tax=Dorcoceras hygrometricum TaxID=472368 RepID=A0A2Z7AYB2_9LAMI|nr:hypothetical protein F511_25474 [Dorcoceras hygrometricum]